MEIINIDSYKHLISRLKESQKTYLLLYKDGTEQSMCAYNNMNDVVGLIENVQFLVADVSQVRDIHEEYAISSVPSLLEFEDEKFVRTIKGCHDPAYFMAVFKNATYSVQNSTDNIKQKRVIVYTTPTCPHCTTLKNYLKEQHIRFREIDVSKDQKMAQELVRKSGQQGVPQADINGQMVVGFDKLKIDRLLEIRS